MKPPAREGDIEDFAETTNLDAGVPGVVAELTTLMETIVDNGRSPPAPGNTTTSRSTGNGS